MHSWAQGHWTEQHLTGQDGLPQSGIHAITMDSLDYLWLATDGGLVRYTGQDFTHFELPGGGAPRSERMRRILASPKGDLVVHDSRGAIYQLHAHHLAFPVGTSGLRAFSNQGGIPDVEIWLRAVDPNAPLEGRDEWNRNDNPCILPFDTTNWAVLTQETVFVYQDSLLKRRVPLKGLRSHAFVADGRLITFDPEGNIFRLGPEDMAFTRSGRAQGWPNHGPEVLPGDRLFWKCGERTPVLAVGREFHLVRSQKDGSVAIEHIPIRLREGAVLADAVWSERLQMLIAALDLEGLLVYRKQLLRASRLQPFEEVENGVTYAQAHWGGDTVIAINPRGWAVMYTKDSCIGRYEGLGSADPGTLARSPDGRILFVKQDRIMALDKATGAVDTIATCGAPISCLYQGLDTLWVGCEDGIGVYSQGTFTRVVNFQRRSGPGIFCIRPARSGGALFADCTGLYRLRQRPWRVEPVGGSEGMCVRAIATIGDLELAGTYGDGPLVVLHDSVRKLPQDRNGFLAHAHGFIPDDKGRIWIPTNHGLFNCRSAELVDWLADPTADVDYAYFGTLSGLENPEFNGGCDPSWLRSPDGSITMSSMGGLVRFNPDNVPDLAEQGVVLIESISADDLGVRLLGDRELSPDTRLVKITFSVTYWGDPLDLRMEYRLHEADPWVHMDPGQRSIVIQDPQPGAYQVEVRLAEAEIDGPAYHAIYFTIPPPFFRTFWGICLLLAAAAALVIAIFKYWSARLRKRNAALEEAVNQRTRRLSEANLELQRSMAVKERLISIVTHDIISPLRFIAQVARSARAAGDGVAVAGPELMNDIQFAAEKLHSNAQNLLNWMKQQEGRIRPKLRNVVPALLVDDLFDRYRGEAAAKGLRLENDIQLDDIIMVDQDLLSIALNNLLMNAVTHTEQGAVRVSASASGGSYRIMVHDTGPGLSAEARMRIERIRKAGPAGLDQVAVEGLGGLGYPIVAGIMDLLGGTFEVSDGSGTGTTILLDLPLVAAQRTSG